MLLPTVVKRPPAYKVEPSGESARAETDKFKLGLNVVDAMPLEIAMAARRLYVLLPTVVKLPPVYNVEPLDESTRA